MPRQIIDEPPQEAESIEEEVVEEAAEETQEAEETTETTETETQETGEEVSASEEEDAASTDQSTEEEGETPPPSPFYEKDGKLYGKLKILGKEVEEPVEKIIASAQKVAAADERFRESAAKEKVFQKIAQNFTENPFEAWSDFLVGVHGVTQEQARQHIVNFCKQVTIQDLKLATMPDEERKVYEQQQEYERLKRENEELRRTHQTTAYEAQRVKKENELLTQALPAIKNAGLDPSDDLTVARVIDKMVLLREAGDDPTFQEAVDLVIADQKTRRSLDAKTLTPEELIELRPDLVKALRERNIEAAVSKRTQAKKEAPKEKPAGPTKKRPGKLKRTTDAEIERQFGRQEY